MISLCTYRCSMKIVRHGFITPCLWVCKIANHFFDAIRWTKRIDWRKFHCEQDKHTQEKYNSTNDKNQIQMHAIKRAREKEKNEIFLRMYVGLLLLILVFICYCYRRKACVSCLISLWKDHIPSRIQLLNNLTHCAPTKCDVTKPQITNKNDED